MSIATPPLQVARQDDRSKLVAILTQRDLDFHTQQSDYASHNFHAFPAKFPPQLPGLFIEELTQPGDIVLDPMQGSGTTLLEACLMGRQAFGFDIDPLAIRISKAKTTPLDMLAVAYKAGQIKLEAEKAARTRAADIFQALENRWDEASKEFIDYWFETDTQIELMALLLEIEKVAHPALKNFFELAFSAIIITKSGGVSLARDLAHTRPHRAKLIYSKNGEILEGAELLAHPPKNLEHATKSLKSPLEEFEKRVQNNLSGLLQPRSCLLPVQITFGDAQSLPLKSDSIDLIVTSPPYASNAIDYMRAHKFSLVWLGCPIGELSQKRSEYIGGEMVKTFTFEGLPDYPASVVAEIARLDAKKGQVLHRYYSEMSRVLSEMYRILKPGKAAVVVVGNSEMRGRDTETQTCLAEIGKSVGFEAPAIGVRNLDRDRRMMPAGGKIDRQSQIQKRMHQEYIIGLYKPDK